MGEPLALAPAIGIEERHDPPVLPQGRTGGIAERHDRGPVREVQRRAARHLDVVLRGEDGHACARQRHGVRAEPAAGIPRDAPPRRALGGEALGAQVRDLGRGRLLQPLGRQRGEATVEGSSVRALAQRSLERHEAGHLAAVRRLDAPQVRLAAVAVEERVQARADRGLPGSQEFPCGAIHAQRRGSSMGSAASARGSAGSMR
ncbi:MAG: hypothetical protein VX460_12675 [Planctomycetota bacterium]|nr:hypothetical protein [Planctomycetota bacterium]